MLLLPGFRGTQEANHFRGSHFDTYSFACAGVLWRSVVSTMEPPRVTGQAQKLHWFKFRCWEPPPVHQVNIEEVGCTSARSLKPGQFPKKKAHQLRGVYMESLGANSGLAWPQWSFLPSQAAASWKSSSSAQVRLELRNHDQLPSDPNGGQRSP